MKNLIIILSFVLFLFSCEKETETIYITKVDSIDVKDTIFVNNLDTVFITKDSVFTSYSIVNSSNWLLDITVYSQDQSKFWQSTINAKQESNYNITTDSILYISYVITFKEIQMGVPFNLIKNKHNKIVF